MRPIIGAEWRRMWSDRANAWMLALFAAVLLASAVSSGLDARAWRAHVAAMEADWQRRVDARVPPNTNDAVQAAKFAFEVARSDAPPAVLHAFGGIGLGSGAFDRLAPAVRVTVESRHTDARREDQLANPLLQGFATPDFATVAALLMPLALICLCAGTVQQGREQNLWRFTLVQCPRVGVLLATALGLRAATVWGIAALASCVAITLDPAASLAPLASWCLALAGVAALWTMLCALIGALPVSSSSAVLAGMGLWLATTFVLPAALVWAIDRHTPMPSRLAAIVQLREAQQRAEAEAGRLLRAWYDRHPDIAAGAPTSHTWPVSFMPRYLAQEAEVGPLMRAFDQARAQRYAALREWAWLSPALSLAMLADELAGIDAPRHARYQRAVERYERRWREYFLPKIMSYRGLVAGDIARMPRFAGMDDSVPAGWRHLGAFAALAILVASMLVALRKWIGRG